MTNKMSEYEAFAAASPGNRRLLKQEKLILGVTETLLKTMIRKKLTKTEIGRRLGKTKAYISQLFTGERNLTLRTISDLADAMGCDASFQLSEKLEIRSWSAPVRWRTRCRVTGTFYGSVVERAASEPPPPATPSVEHQALSA